MAGGCVHGRRSTLCLASVPHSSSSRLVLRVWERVATNTIEGKGSYILLIELPSEQTIAVGSLKSLHFPRGYYAYIGSALGGFKPRLNRHLKRNKRPHWHIDYLLAAASINNIILSQTENRVECSLAQALSRHFDSVPGFGCSDCKCRSHLFFAADEEQMKSTIIATLNLLGIRLSTTYIPKRAEVNKGVSKKGDGPSF